ncbi:MAG: hypothetical protein B7Y40_08830 [Gammaproteobacteria bacterium 28-57-27]|nr:MAG: hypothetical protein B7Y40_08830 [Gammaproteobacteria bacterium 28-57-27]
MHTIKAVLFASVLLGMSAAGWANDTGTQVFRSVDAQGNVVFTDTPRQGAKPVEIQAPSSVTPLVPPPAAAAAPSAPPVDSQAFAGYQALVITQPENGAGLNNGTGDVDVSVSLVPPLRTDLGHGLTVTMDGSPVLQNSARMNVALADVSRGEHVLEAFVVSAQGQVMFQSAPVRFSLQRTSLFLPGRANQQSPSNVPTPRATP